MHKPVDDSILIPVRLDVVADALGSHDAGQITEAFNALADVRELVRKLIAERDRFQKKLTSSQS